MFIPYVLTDQEMNVFFSSKDVLDDVGGAQNCGMLGILVQTGISSPLIIMVIKDQITHYPLVD